MIVGKWRRDETGLDMRSKTGEKRERGRVRSSGSRDPRTQRRRKMGCFVWLEAGSTAVGG